MSNAAAAEPSSPAPRGKKKLLIIASAAVLLLAVAGGGAFMLLKKGPAHADDDDEVAQVDEPKAKAAKGKGDAKAVPVFVALDPFTVNLADRDNERYAQVAVTLEVTDAKAGEQVKAFLPAVRNNILMVLAHKTSEELLQREGKTQLADEIRRETARALGVEPDDDAPRGDGKKKPGAKKRAEPVVLPVVAVHFSNFIVQ